ncbi:MAG: LLM class flavin-dependent oxidoreductase [Rhodospirillaceae bacterium]|jgi:alkanesulfonate monooxygenase SsuD/methylene tetrahydromethanopterin reductase-like flavin-dependent oxidoreductase (luciferase family)|nr:LLM class flavin-dependent oxidoreductase [Rhodospirillaceae bacterium]MBT5944142.1 LLM class flavin-dependent oxidoreductase [Rhodospirillaceae bacterium]MBT6405331.1 LLM class flavin-dependent oxidoreductase [Rhodospirillaceae bacterium]MBT6537719.1 LLM class flavin-dependent oxidoreductase [Rhodospirillaceae bacterium]MBT7361478.1 LLM class flavin-dependent oxidoreductase [Rhodospirillaceae bacterium]
MAKPKVIVNMYPVLPAVDEADRAAKRPIGRNSEIYNTVLHEMVDIVKAADDLGVWGVSTIEHHLHSEGYELAPSPGIVNAMWSQHVKNARVGTIGYVAATRDPIRMAEEMAVMDHVTQGKYFAGFARGYQARWAHILGQYVDAQATSSDGGEVDIRNRELFEERVLQVVDCWKNETVSFDGKYYKAPYPYDTGVENFPAAPVAQRMGAPGEIDADGTTVRRVSVVPKPYQDPHPPVFVAVSASPDSIRFCSRNGFSPVYFTPTDHLVELAKVYVDEGAKTGRDLQFGANQTIVRWPHFSRDKAHFREQLAAYDAEFYKNIYGSFFPFLVDGVDSDEAMVDRMVDTGIFIGGTVEDTIAEWKHTYERIPSEYICLIWHYAMCPKEKVIEELEIFMEKVLPELDIPDFDPVLPAG